MYKRKEFQELMPKGYDIQVHVHSSIGNTMPTKAVHVSVKGIELNTGLDFEEHATEVFNPTEIADTVKRLLKAKQIETAEFTDVLIYQ